jgi:hypothetical protein
LDKKALILGIGSLLIVWQGASAGALRECIEGDASKRADVQVRQVVFDKGCTTAPSEFLDSMTFNGFRVHDCAEDVCWKALPGYVITDAVVTSSSAAGTRHSFSRPTYVPDKTRAIGVCVRVEATGIDGEVDSTSGWQKINVTVTTRRVLSQSQLIEIAEKCVVEGKR